MMEPSDFWGHGEYAPTYGSGDCQRCGYMHTFLYKHYKCVWGDDCDPRNYGKPLKPIEREVIYICWDCDWEIINGRGDYNDDPYDIEEQRREEEDPY